MNGVKHAEKCFPFFHAIKHTEYQRLIKTIACNQINEYAKILYFSKIEKQINWKMCQEINGWKWKMNEGIINCLKKFRKSINHFFWGHN